MRCDTLRQRLSPAGRACIHQAEQGRHQTPDLDRWRVRERTRRAARSSRLTTHFDLDFPKRPQTEPYHCYKHARTCQPTQDALQFLNRYGLDTLQRIKEFSRIARSSKTVIVHGDARFAQLPKFDLAITSPPYVGLIDYHEQHRYAYELLGLPSKAEHEIGAALHAHQGG